MTENRQESSSTGHIRRLRDNATTTGELLATIFEVYILKESIRQFLHASSLSNGAASLVVSPGPSLREEGLVK